MQFVLLIQNDKGWIVIHLVATNGHTEYFVDSLLPKRAIKLASSIGLPGYFTQFHQFITDFRSISL